MGESWVGFSGSYPFGSVAQGGAIEESTRAGADAQPAKSNSENALKTHERLMSHSSRESEDQNIDQLTEPSDSRLGARKPLVVLIALA